MSAAEPERTLMQALAEMMAGVRAHGLPPEAEYSVRQRILDTLGVCIAAGHADTARPVREHVQAQGGTPQAVAVGLAHRVPATLAAFVNGSLAHSLEFDDTHLPSVIHPSASIIPACLAAGQLASAPDTDLICAIAAGLEACVRLGMAGYNPAARQSDYFERGQHATSMCGAIAGAGAAALLLGSDATGIMNAMSIAVSMASGVVEANRTGGTVKRMHCGWAAHAAVSAASLARLGLTGPATALEGRFGFFRAFLDGSYDSGQIVNGLGIEWSFSSTNFKPYPANHFTHAGIDAAIALRRRGIRLDDIESLTLGVAGPAVATIGEPAQLKRTPATAYQAQFSGPYTVVAALCGGTGLGLGIDDFTDELVLDQDRRALMSKVNVVEDPACTAIFPVEFGAVLTAVLATGEKVIERVTTTRGGARRPLSEKDVAVKFRDNAKRVLAESEIQQIQTTLENLGHGPGDMNGCLELLSRRMHSSDPGGPQASEAGEAHDDQ